jgi:phosphoribosylanthranilate isomerase
LPDILVKICGITNVEDALYSVDQGADIVGVVLSEKSPRRGTPDLINRLISLGIHTAGIYTDMESVRNIASLEEYVQLHFPHGKEEISFVKEKLGRRVISVVFAYEEKSPLSAAHNKLMEGSDLVLLEYGKEGWASIHDSGMEIGKEHIGIAGKVSVENLKSLISYSPYFIDVSSSLEMYAGKKDHSKIRKFMEVFRAEEAAV